jgi:O-antigen/teichoic acid export membrane protein
MKDTIIIILGVVLIFFISFFLGKYKARPKIRLMFSAVAIIVFAGILLKEIRGKESAGEIGLPLLLGAGLILYLIIDFFKVYRQLKRR